MHRHTSRSSDTKCELCPLQRHGLLGTSCRYRMQCSLDRWSRLPQYYGHLHSPQSRTGSQEWESVRKLTHYATLECWARTLCHRMASALVLWPPALVNYILYPNNASLCEHCLVRPDPWMEGLCSVPPDGKDTDSGRIAVSATTVIRAFPFRVTRLWYRERRRQRK